MSKYDDQDGTASSHTPEQRTRAGGMDPTEQLRPDPDVLENGLPYISKSRVKKFLTCAAKFYWTYICGRRAPQNYHMVKGIKLHRTFEDFHLNLIDYVEREGDRPDRFTDLLPHYSEYTQWIEQLGSFMRFEERRWRESSGLNTWLPVEVEAEAWLGEPPQSWIDDNGTTEYVSGSPPIGDAPWMGRADLIAHTDSVPNVDGDGVTIIDYKTGSVPDKRYREEGIFTEGSYYGILFEPFFDIDAVAGYYPSEDTFISSPYPDPGRRDTINQAVLEMQNIPDAVNNNGPPDEFPHEEQPLCNYDGGGCLFYNICPSTWEAN
jgi:hypothetical protein